MADIGYEQISWLIQVMGKYHMADIGYGQMVMVKYQSADFDHSHTSHG